MHFCEETEAVVKVRMYYNRHRGFAVGCRRYLHLNTDFIRPNISLDSDWSLAFTLSLSLSTTHWKVYASYQSYLHPELYIDL